jgi:hypothetical protein
MTEPDRSLLQRIPRIMPIFILIAALYVAWIFYSRWSEAHDAQRAAATREVELARKDVELNGGTQLKVTMFYSSTDVVGKGQPVQLCYGVVNAKNVAINPPVGELWPSANRCVEVSPKKNTTYTLTADDGAGHSDKKQVSVQVVPLN